MNSRQLNIILGILIVLLLGAVIYLAYDRKSEPAYVYENDAPIAAEEKQLPPAAPAPTQTEKPAVEKPAEEWKRYTNATYDYSFEYPSEWKVAVRDDQHVLFGPNATKDSGHGWIDYIGDLSSGQTLAAFVKDFNIGLEAGSRSERPAVINGNNVIISILPKGATMPTESKAIAFTDGKRVFYMSTMYRTEFDKYPEDKKRLETFNKMIETFSFLK